MPNVNGKSLSPDEAMLLGLCPECGVTVTPRVARSHAESHWGADPDSARLSDEGRRRFKLLLDFAHNKSVGPTPGSPAQPKPQPTNKPAKTPDTDTRNWIVVGLWGLMFATIFGEGLYAFVDDHWGWGSIYTAVGVLGVIAVDQTARGKRLATLYPAEYRVSAMMVATVVLFLTWVLVGYDIYDRHHNNPTNNRSSGSVSEPSSETGALSDSRDPTPKEAEVIRDLAIKGSYQVAVFCLTSERDSCHYAKEWLRIFNTAGWKTNGLNETDYAEAIHGLVVCKGSKPRDSPLAVGEFELAIRENAIPLSDQCPDPRLTTDPNIDFTLLVGSP